MKKKGSVCVYTHTRNEDLKKAFKNTLSSAPAGKVSSLIDAMATAPAPRFYIDETRAYRLIRERINKGSWPERMLPGKRKMIEEIWTRSMLLMHTDPGLHLYDAVITVIHSPAPSFYLTPGSMRTILYATLAH